MLDKMLQVADLKWSKAYIIFSLHPPPLIWFSILRSPTKCALFYDFRYCTLLRSEYLYLQYHHPFSQSHCIIPIHHLLKYFIFNFRVPERTLSCPICNVEMNIPANGLTAISDNTFATNMLNILAVQNPTTCTNCEDRELANSRCLDCVENLCSNCVSAHERIRQTKSHKVIPFDELQNNAVHEAIKCPSFCKIHEEEVGFIL